MKRSFRAVGSTLMLSLLMLCANGQEPLNPLIEAYIDMYRPIAIREMQRTGVPAAIKIAQGILESEAGKSHLVRQSNNHFGIKCKSNWTGEKVYHDDDARGECFRKYVSPEDSYRDHSDFLKFQPRYAALFQMDPTDYKSWAYGLKSAGYATNPKYPESLIRLIETYRLNEITEIALKRPEGVSDSSTLSSAMPESKAVPLVTGAPAATVSPVQDVVQPAVHPPVQQYPEGVFRSEGTKSVFARRGTSMLALAENHGVRLSKLLSYNHLKASDDVLQEDRVIYLQRKRHRASANESKKKRWEPFKFTTGYSSHTSRLQR